MKNIRLMLVDDHEVVRTGLRTFLETKEGIQVVAEANSGMEALQLAGQVQLDVVVMDISMPDMDGLETTRRMLVVNPDCKILALTIHADKQYFFEMLAAGAVGYVTKQAAADDLVAAIHAVADGNVYLQPTLARWLLEDYRRLLSRVPPDLRTETGEPIFHKDLETLSERELQVLELVADGLTNAEIGENLGISPKTVARHRERIMSKLDLHSRADLVKFAIRTGLIGLN
ncbi:MAG: response regulator transcription factor [Anaerolineales bacterium]|nr:response regulator transcription factor [Anaerolineales bacterium]